MKAFQNHIQAISNSFKNLLQGKFLLFFLPGLCVGIIFWQLFSALNTAEESLGFFDSVPLIGGYIQKGIESTFSFLDLIIEQFFIFFVLTILSPFNTILSEKVDSDLTGKKYPFDFGQLLMDFFRMILVVILAIIMEITCFGVYWVISWIFGLGAIDQVIYFLIAAFFYGFSFYDYSLERYHKGVFTSIGFAFSNMLTVTLSGSFFLILYYIPYVGIIIAPVLTTIIATYVYLLNQNSTLSLKRS